LFSDTAEVKGRLDDPFFHRISQTMKRIEIFVQQRGRMLNILLVCIPNVLFCNLVIIYLSADNVCFA